MLVPYFPPMRPDETLYSLICRYFIHTGSFTWANTYTELFGYKDVKNISIDFPTKINEIIKRIPPSWGITEEYLIRNCTLFPLYRPFLETSLAQDVFKMMRNSNEGLILTKLGLRWDRDSNIYYCTVCSIDDIKKYGETYIRRIHQVPGVLVCPKHGTILSKIYRNPSRQELPFITKEDMNSSTTQSFFIEEREQNFLWDLSKDLSWLLSNYEKIDCSSICERYFFILKQKGYILHLGKMKCKKLLEDLINFYSCDLLNILGLSHIYKKYHWLFELISFEELKLKYYPIRHVLLMRFLAGSVENFFNIEISKSNIQAPFRDGPWYCLNPAATHYKQKVVKEIDIKYLNSNIYVGIFICDCGYIYTKRGPFKDEKDELSRGRVLQFGHVWENELLRLINQGKTLKVISEELCITIDALKRVMVEHNINCGWKLPQNYVSQKRTFSLEKKRDKFRKEIEQTLKSRPDISRTDLIAKNYQAYHWLKQHDNVWINSIVVNVRIIKKNSHYKYDVNLDNEVMGKVQDLLDNWDSDGKRPTRITKRRISELMNLTTRFMLSLPNTTSLLNSSIETKANYLKRLADWIIKGMQEQQISEKDIYQQIPIKYPKKWFIEYVQSKLGLKSKSD
ncbi:TnsD family Tn7-like transposition protein [Neobacillus massiliamazoniensis]|uniref:Tn7-like transposition protein D n=1 Tax=Neobacillus massiliamazoniensis TaxID=1499688 RepID=A0A0U1P514_9BACI|nr:TnsD family Tn7-like transposition protein [Neobacillus massiliamazoniensis]CRK85221.1 Tn7-like transposition protein D [Neobacillus massiliamazoniensis]